MRSTSTPSTKPCCEHFYLRQTILSPVLPPIYIANPTPPPPANFPSLTNLTSVSSLTAPISPFLITQLERVHSRLGPKTVPSPFLARDLEKLQHELEAGMTQARRLQVEVYVAGIRDPWKKATTELYLARYPGFVMRGDGRLDFGTRKAGQVGKGGSVKWDWRAKGGCGVM